MAVLKHKHQDPPDGWKYLQRETGVWIRGEFLDELVNRVIAHREYKRLGPTEYNEVELEVQRQICLGMPDGVCRGEAGEDYRPFKDMGRTLSLKKIAAFSETLLEWLKNGSMVPKPESERRAGVCRGCVFNKPLPNCACTPFYKVIDALIPKERVEPGLSICTLCGCALKAKVLAPMEVVREGNPQGLRVPSYCWQQ